jgi:hypothetical protein
MVLQSSRTLAVFGRERHTMPTSGEIVRKAFDDWMSGTGYVASIFSPDMTWEIVGHFGRLGHVLDGPRVPGQRTDPVRSTLPAG